MFEITLKIGHLSIVASLIFIVNGYAVDSPLCGTMDGSLTSIGDHKIYFKDKDHAIRTIELNGQITGCYSNSMDDPSKTWSRSFSASVNKCAEKFQIFCVTKDDGYPLKYMEYLLQKHSHSLGYAFGSDDQYVAENTVAETTTQSDLCASHSEVLYPTTGRTADGNELYIFNTNKQQGVMISICENQGASCHESDQLANRTQCQQRFVYRELLALSPEGVPIKEKFRFPSFCTCAKKNSRNEYWSV